MWDVLVNPDMAEVVRGVDRNGFLADRKKAEILRGNSFEKRLTRFEHLIILLEVVITYLIHPFLGVTSYPKKGRRRRRLQRTSKE